MHKKRCAPRQRTEMGWSCDDAGLDKKRTLGGQMREVPNKAQKNPYLSNAIEENKTTKPPGGNVRTPGERGGGGG